MPVLFEFCKGVNLDSFVECGLRDVRSSHIYDSRPLSSEQPRLLSNTLVHVSCFPVLWMSWVDRVGVEFMLNPSFRT